MKTIAVLVACVAFTWTACDGRKSPAVASKDSPPSEANSPTKGQLTRLAWHETTLLEGYRAMDSPGAWDKPVEEALRIFAKICTSKLHSSELHEPLKKHLKEAIEAGCDDPLIRYIQFQYVENQNKVQSEETGAVARGIAESLDTSRYHPLYRMYAHLTAAAATPNFNDVEGKIQRNRFAPYAGVSYRLRDVVKDHTVPVQDLYEAVHDWAQTFERNRIQIAGDMAIFEPELQQRGDDPFILLARGEAAIFWAWEARGRGYSGSVTPDGWKLYRERLANAQKLLESAWKAAPTNAAIPTAMLRAVGSQQGAGAEMEKWFERAMELDTNNYTACDIKLNYLQPKWNGSRENMVAFGRECLTNEWGGSVPLILVDAHDLIARLLPESERSDYFRNDEVWHEIQKCYEKFFVLNPDKAGVRHNYAWFAFQAGRWNVFHDQLRQFRGTNYAYFGGKDEFEQMVNTARQRATARSK